MEKKDLKQIAAVPMKRGRKPKAQKKSEGLGDTIEKITEATGIKAAVDWFSEATGIDCGCDTRKKILNEILPYKKANCLLKAEYDYLTEFYSVENKLTLNSVEQRKIAEIHARVFNHLLDVPCTCSPKRWAAMVSELKKVYSQYKPE